MTLALFVVFLTMLLGLSVCWIFHPDNINDVPAVPCATALLASIILVSIFLSLLSRHSEGEAGLTKCAVDNNVHACEWVAQPKNPKE